MADSRHPLNMEVNVIVPVHNAADTIVEAVESAMTQDFSGIPFRIDLFVCCYDDGSSDTSWEKLLELQAQYIGHENSKLLLARSSTSRGAGFARNRAVDLRKNTKAPICLLCMLDSDDVMHPTRVREQCAYMLSLETLERKQTLLGCTFNRVPTGSTWHYAQWANNLPEERLVLERFREVTLLQPTWMMERSWFEKLGGYLEAPHPSETCSIQDYLSNLPKSDTLRLVHPEIETVSTLRVAEDLRFFHAHLREGGRLRLLRTPTPLLTYRHRAGQSQSSQTPRRLLLSLRTRAFELDVLNKHWNNYYGAFAVWGAGRDGKDFLKSLSEDNRHRVYCVVDVDDKKIAQSYYVNRQLNLRIPIVHYSLLVRDLSLRTELVSAWINGEEPGFGRIDKKQNQGGEKQLEPPKKKHRISLLSLPPGVDAKKLQDVPVVVCVAMYRTNGALEKNVATIGRTEGLDLWHFC